MLNNHEEHEVELVVVSTHLYNIYARTPEEAATVAEQLLLEDGDEGQVTGRTIENSDAYRIDSDFYKEEK